MTNAEYLAMVESWAAEFRIENYRASMSGSQVRIEFERPEPLERILAPRNVELQATNVLSDSKTATGASTKTPVNGLLRVWLKTSRPLERSTKIPSRPHRLSVA